MGLDNDDSWKGNKTQSANAREQYELYDWWTNQRPYRQDDAMEEWEAYHKVKKEVYGDDADNFFRDDLDTKELKKLQKKWLTKSNKIEKDNLKEDEKMLIRLVKIRSSLWT
jgi:histidinol phosphatase-like PHP family hydrolase